MAGQQQQPVYQKSGGRREIVMNVNSIKLVTEEIVGFLNIRAQNMAVS
jgi:hypothetical protein